MQRDGLTPVPTTAAGRPPRAAAAARPPRSHDAEAAQPDACAPPRGAAAEPGEPVGYRTLVRRLRYLLVYLALTVVQYSVLSPSVQFLELTFFAAARGGGDCEAAPSSEPCRQAAAFAAVFHGACSALSAGAAWFAALALGSASDSVGRRPLIRAKAAVSVLPVAALALHVFAGRSLWIFLVLQPAYLAFDVNGVFLAFMSDMVPEPKARLAGFGVLYATYLGTSGAAELVAGAMPARTAVVVSAATCAAKLVFAFVAMPETAPLDLPCGRAPGPAAAIRDACALFRRSAFISRMAVVMVTSGVSAAGLSTVLAPYITAYLGVTKPEAARLMATSGFSVLVCLALLLRPLVAALGEVGALRAALAAAAVYPALLARCTEVRQLFAVAALLAGPMGLLFPVISAIKSNLVSEEDQGLLQGAIASARVFAVALSHMFFGWFYSYQTRGGEVRSRAVASLPLLGAALLGSLALLVAHGLPEQPSPPPRRKRAGATGRPDLHEAIAAAAASYSSVKTGRGAASGA